MAARSPRLPGFDGADYPVHEQLFGNFLCGLWATACDALHLPADQSVPMLRAALPAWAAERIGTSPTRPSYVSDDGFPAEMSVNWSGQHPELRLLFDTLTDNYSPSDTWPDTTKPTPAMRRLRELFTPLGGRPAPAPLWHSIAWRPPAHVVHKTYFGLYAWPLAERDLAVSEAMDWLNMTAAWNNARRRIGEVDGQREIEFFAVDHADRANARVKVYYRNHGADIREMNRIASVAQRHDARSALAAYQTLTGGQATAGEAALSCLAFRPGLDHVAESTTYLRLADLAPSDEHAVDRTAELLRSEGVNPGRLRALAAAVTPRPLADSRGLLCLVSHRAAGRPSDITTYFRFPVYQQPTPVDLVVTGRKDDPASAAERSLP